MDNNAKTLYLIASNASEEYMLDALEVLALPLGMVQHFRYDIKWLDKDLEKKVPKERENGEKDRKKLKNVKVVICYLYQEKDGDKWVWKEIYPLRIGVLIDAYKTGDDNGVAHFYFKVNNYINDVSKIPGDLKEMWSNGEKWGKFYAFFDGSLEDRYSASKDDSKSAFQNTCNALKPKYFKYSIRKKYYPIFCFIDGIKDKNGKFITPKYEQQSHQSFYEFEEGSKYTFQFFTYFPENSPSLTFELVSDKRIFSTPEKYEFKIGSRYDERFGTLISSLLEKDVWSHISFKTKAEEKEIDGKKFLHIFLNFPVLVKRKLWYRLIDLGGDIGSVVGTACLGLSKFLESWSWWYWPVIIGYFIWAVSKLIVRIWRG